MENWRKLLEEYEVEDIDQEPGGPQPENQEVAIEMGSDNYKNFIKYKIEKAVLDLEQELKNKIEDIFGSGRNRPDEYDEALEYLQDFVMAVMGNLPEEEPSAPADPDADPDGFTPSDRPSM